MDKLYIVKIGGAIIDDDQKLEQFLGFFAAVAAPKLLVHGGGKEATRLAEVLNIPQTMIDGKRVTNADTLKIITMVYAGYVNKKIVAGLQAVSCNTVGLTGADGASILAHKRTSGGVDFGFVGDVDEINIPFFKGFLAQNITPVVAPVTHNGKGQLLNTNADTIAQELAKALSATYNVHLVYGFEKEGVLMDVSDDATLISKITPANYNHLQSINAISDGMLPKLANAFEALEAGVKKVTIGNALRLPELINGSAGTSIAYD